MTLDQNATCFCKQKYVKVYELVGGKNVVDIARNVWMSVEKQFDAKTNDYVVQLKHLEKYSHIFEDIHRI